MANGPGNVWTQPFFLKTPDFYMIDQQRRSHDETIYAYGEYSMFVLLWGITDYQAGAVQRCPYCYNRGGSQGSTDAVIASVYGQPALANCPYCYGTTFYLNGATQLGGVKAQIVRPCMWQNTDEEHKRVPEGDMITSVSQVQTISDFRMRSGDFVFRADGTRWRVQPHETNVVISGFQAANDINAMIGYNYPACVREDEASVAYTIPPNSAQLATILDISVVPNYPLDFAQYETYNATNLIGDDYTPGP